MFGSGLRAIGPTLSQYLLIPSRHHALKRSQLTPLAYRVTLFSTSCSRSSKFAANSGRRGGTQSTRDSQETWYKGSRGGYIGIAIFAFILGGAGIITFAVSNVAFTDAPPSKLTVVSPPETPVYPEMPVQSGHLGNLTAEQEAKLRSLWAITLKTFGVTDPSPPEKDIAPIQEPADAVSSTSPEKEKKKKRLFSRKNDKDKAGNGDSVASSPGLPAVDDDKYGQTKELYEILEKQAPEELRTAFWTMVKADHPDALLLRFLRARKWDVDKALAMLISTMHWRSAVMLVDEDVIKHGEGGAQEDSQSSDKAVKKEGEDFLQQLKLGKSFLHGTDKEGRPICVVRVRLHKPGEQSERSMERYTVFVIETARLVLRPPVDTAVSFLSHRLIQRPLTTPVHHFRYVTF
jgi:CRAL/TRIO, N-terminal domain/CRAL/TRIO domain